MDVISEAKSNGGKIGPTAVGEPVDIEGREAEDSATQGRTPRNNWSHCRKRR